MRLQAVETRPWIDGSGICFLMSGGGKEVRCFVQQGALDIIEQTMDFDMGLQLDRFSRHRVTFEAIASDLHDAGLPLRITADHVTKLRRP